MDNNDIQDKGTKKKRWIRRSTAGREKAMMSEQEIDSIVEEGKGRERALQQLGMGVGLIAVAGALVWGAGMLGMAQWGTLGSGEVVEGSQSSAESHGEGTSTGDKNEGVGDSDGLNHSEHGEEEKHLNHKPYEEFNEETLKEMGITLPKTPDGQKLYVSPESRNVSDYLVDKYFLPKGTNMVVLNTKTIENGVEYHVLSPNNFEQFYVRKDEKGNYSDNYLHTVYQNVKPRNEWLRWFREYMKMRVGIDFADSSWTPGWVDHSIKGDINSQAFKSNPAGLIITLKEGTTVEDGRELVKDFLKAVQGENSGFKNEFTVEVRGIGKDRGRTETYQINIHGEPKTL